MTLLYQKMALAVIDIGASKISAVWVDFLGHVEAYSVPAGYTATPGTVTAQSRSSGYGLLPGEAAVPRWSQNTGAGLTTNLAATLAWQGRRIDAAGYYSVGAREYNPQAGRFLSPDPLGHSASWDLYSYAHGDPINYTDVTGRNGTASGDQHSLLSGTSYSSPSSDLLSNGRSLQANDVHSDFTANGPSQPDFVLTGDTSGTWDDNVQKFFATAGGSTVDNLLGQAVPVANAVNRGTAGWDNTMTLGATGNFGVNPNDPDYQAGQGGG